MAKKPADDAAKPEEIDPAAAEEAAAEETVPPKETVREQVMETIQADRREQLRENGIEIPGEEEAGEDDPDAPDDPDAAADPDDPETAAAGAEEEDTPAAAEEEGTEPAAASPEGEMVTIVVDGQERQEPLSNLVANFQKNAAADSRLLQANEILDAAEQARQRILSGQDQPAAQPDPADDKEKDSNPLDAIDWQAAVDKLQFGSKEEGATALRELVENVSEANAKEGVSFDMEATQQALDQRADDRAEWRDALADFGENYQDIIEDTQLQTMTANRADQIFQWAVEESVKAGRPGRPSYAEVFRVAGDQTRAWLKSVRGEENADPDPDPQPNPSAEDNVQLSKERTELKRKTSTIPKPRSVAKSKGAAEAKQKTANQIRREGIDQIIKDRDKQKVA